MATAAFDHHPLPLLGFHTKDQDDFKSAPDAKLSPSVSLKPICSPNGFFPPWKDGEQKSVLISVLFGVGRNTFCHDFNDKMIT